jgi:hypothetical protein
LLLLHIIAGRGYLESRFSSRSTFQSTADLDPKSQHDPHHVFHIVVTVPGRYSAKTCRYVRSLRAIFSLSLDLGRTYSSAARSQYIDQKWCWPIRKSGRPSLACRRRTVMYTPSILNACMPIYIYSSSLFSFFSDERTSLPVRTGAVVAG